jgi:hypothetical protein
MAQVASKLRKLRKGRSLKLHANANVASVSAHRIFGKGGYRVKANGKTYATVTRLA